MTPSVAAIVLNFNAAEDTIECVSSLKKCGYPKLEIVVVDNGSSDDSERKIADAVHDVEVLQTGRNLGFAAGNNFGIRHALKSGYEYVLLINNDTLVEPGFLDGMVAVLEENPNGAASGGTVCYYPEMDTIWYGGGRFVALRASSFTDLVGRSYRSLKNLDVREVTFITGCLMLLRTSVIRRQGALDERFFLYLEDAELSIRLVRAGYQLFYVPRALIYHKIKHRGTGPLQIYFSTRNRLLFAKITTTGVRRLLATGYLLGTSGLKMFFWVFARPEFFRAAKLGLVDYYQNKLFEGHGLEFVRPASAGHHIPDKTI